MKLTTLKSVAIAVGLASPVFGQTATSPVVGYYTEDLDPGFNLLGVSLHQKPLISGTFESDLTDTDGGFTAALSDASLTYLVEIEDGAQAGAVAEIASFTDTALTVEGGLATGGAAYTIRAASTLTDIFGDSLQSSFNADAADVVFIPDGAGGFTQYFQQTAGDFRLTTAPFVAGGPVPVFYPDGLLVQVRADANPARSVVVSGDLKTAPTAVSNIEGFNVVSNPGPVGVTLGNIGLSDLTASFNADAADIVFLPTGAGAFTQYFPHTSGVFRLTTSPFAGDESAVEVPSAFFIQRRTAGTSTVATVPSFFAGL